MPRTVASCSLLALRRLPLALPPCAPGAQTGDDRHAGDRGREAGARDPAAMCRHLVLHAAHHTPDTGDVTCSVQKTWRKEVLTKIMQRG